MANPKYNNIDNNGLLYILETLKSEGAQTLANAKEYTESVTADCVLTVNLDAAVAKLGYVTIGTADLKYATIEKSDIIEANIQKAVGDFSSFKTGEFETLKAKQADFETATANELDAIKANIKELDVDNLDAKYAKVEDLNAANAKIGALEAGQIKTEYLDTHYAQIDLANIKDGSITTAMIGTGVVGTAQIADGSITDAKIVELTANKINAGTLSVERLEIRGSTSSIVYGLNNITGALQAQNTNTLNGEILTSRTITADKIVANAITANEIASKTITANNIASNTITADSGIIANAAITNAMIANLDASKIKTGTLSADRIDVNGIFAKDITATGTITGANLVGATGSFSGSLSVSGTYIPQDLTLEDARKFNTVINKDGLVTSDTEYYTAKLYPDSLEISYPDIGEYGSGKDMQTIITADHVAVTSTDGSQPNSEMSREGFYAYGPNDDLVRESHMDGYGLTISSYEYAAGHLTPVSNIFMENNSISIEAPTTSQPKVTVNNGEYGVGLLIGAGGVNHGLYDFTNGRWMIYKGSAEATTMTQDTFTIGNKTGYQDGKTGIGLFREGYMHLQRASSSGNPYIGFYRDTSTSVALLELKSNNKFRFNKALELNGTNIDSVGQQGIYSMDMSNYVVRYYVAGSTKCTALGNNNYATRIYGSAVWANKAVSTSDERLKTDFKSLDSMMNIFMELEPVSFRWKQDYEDGDNLIHFGLKAQQVQHTFEKYGYNTDDYSVIGEFGGYKGICYDDLFMMTMCATQKNTKELMYQAGQIDLHETMIQDLQNQIYKLEKQLKELRQASA